MFSYSWFGIWPFTKPRRWKKTPATAVAVHKMRVADGNNKVIDERQKNPEKSFRCLGEISNTEGSGS